MPAELSALQARADRMMTNEIISHQKGAMNLGRTARKQVDPMGPTLERLEKLTDGDLEIGEDRTGGRIYTISDAPVARMFKSKRLSGIQFTALSRFHSHWWNAGLSGSVRSVDLNRIYAPDPFDFCMGRTEKQFNNRREYEAAYKLLTFLEGILVTNLICSESLNLEQCGNMLGYLSPFRARTAATKVVCSIADKFAKHWGIG
jgi:hypothetical protein